MKWTMFLTNKQWLCQYIFFNSQNQWDYFIGIIIKCLITYLNNFNRWGTVAHVCNPSASEAEAEKSVWSQSGLHSELQVKHNYIMRVCLSSQQELHTESLSLKKVFFLVVYLSFLFFCIELSAYKMVCTLAYKVSFRQRSEELLF